MEKNIQLSGLSTDPADYSCDDGNLASAINVFHKENSIQATEFTCPKLIKNMGGDKALYEHRSTKYENTISIGSDGLYYYYKTSTGEEIKKYFSGLSSSIEIKSISSLGSTLVVFTDGKTYYYNWDMEDDSESNYKYDLIGTELPYIEIAFGLKSELAFNGKSQNYYITIPNLSGTYGTYSTEIAEADRATVTDSVIGTINSSLSDENEEGYFVMPFLVTYGFRLYDGTMVRNSCPVLMVPMSGKNPLPVISTFETHCLYYSVAYMRSILEYEIQQSNFKEILEPWENIIKSVDVFVSSPLYDYDAEGTIEEIGTIDASKIYTIGTIDKIVGTVYYEEDTESDDPVYLTKPLAARLEHRKWDLTNVVRYTKTTDQFRNIDEKKLFVLKDLTTDVDDISTIIKNTGTFYLLESIKVKDLVASGQIVKAGGYLNSIATKESMKNVYQPLDNISATMGVSYNGRLSFVNATVVHYNKFGLRHLFAIQNTSNDYTLLSDDTGYKIEYEDFFEEYKESPLSTSYYQLETKSGGTELFTSYSEKVALSSELFVPYLYFPYAIINKQELHKDGTEKIIFEMEENTFIDGSSYFDDFNQPSYESESYTFSTKYISNSNSDRATIYTSELYNPYAFKAANVEQIGSGKIIALVPQAIALSQGQFGEYPMMAFTTDGIWALSVNDTGGWSAKQPFSRDVVLNEDAGNILQLDRQIMFASNRGLMMISGSEVECISEVFDGNKDSFGVYSSSTSYKAGNDFITTYILPLTNILSTRSDANKDNLFNDFKTFIGNAVFLYDYTHQRIIIGNEDYPFAFVYNIKDKLWTSICQRITSAVNSYPNCYAMTKIGTTGNESNLLVDFSATDGVASQVGLPTEGFILTRPIKLDDADGMKTITKIMARGNMKNSSVDLVLLGSRNLSDWVIVGNCKGNRLSLHHGTAYKYFRVGIITRLGETESLSSLDVEYDNRLDNKMR